MYNEHARARDKQTAREFLQWAATHHHNRHVMLVNAIWVQVWGAGEDIHIDVTNIPASYNPNYHLWVEGRGTAQSIHTLVKYVGADVLRQTLKRERDTSQAA